MILIIANYDHHTRQIVRRLRAKGAEVARFNVADMPRDSCVSAWLGDGEAARVQVRRAEDVLDLARVSTLWFRRLAPTVADDALDEADGQFARDEASSYLYSVASMLDDRFCVNPIASAIASDKGRGKVNQIELARRIGMDVPRTLVTNDPRAASAFLEKSEHGAIYKTIRTSTRTVGQAGAETREAIFTTKLDAAAREQIESVRFAPCIFQELVPKRFDLRVIVMGNKVFGTEIHSQVHDESAIDFRRHYALESTPYAAHDVPDTLADQCRTLNRKLGLLYGAYDFVCTPDGRYVFLEVNQQGQFLWLEEMTGQPLLENFCEMLIQRRPDFRCEVPSHAPGALEPCPPVDEYDVEPAA